MFILISIAIILEWPILYLMKTSMFLSLHSGKKFLQRPERYSKKKCSTVSFAPSSWSQNGGGREGLLFLQFTYIESRFSVLEFGCLICLILFYPIFLSKAIKSHKKTQLLSLATLRTPNKNPCWFSVLFIFSLLSFFSYPIRLREISFIEITVARKHKNKTTKAKIEQVYLLPSLHPQRHVQVNIPEHTLIYNYVHQDSHKPKCRQTQQMPHQT